MENEKLCRNSPTKCNRIKKKQNNLIKNDYRLPVCFVINKKKSS